MRKAATVCVIAAALTACQQEGPSLAGLPNIPFDTTGLGTLTGSTSLKQRMSTMDQLQTVLNGLSPSKFDANTTLLMQSMRATAQFATVGSSPDGTVWGVFKGGIAVYIVTGASPDGSSSGDVVPTQAAKPWAPVAARPARLFASSRPATTVPSRGLRASAFSSLAQAAGGTVPVSNHYRLLNALGGVFGNTDPRSDLASMLTSNGYSGSGPEDATLSTLRSISGDGVFYYRAHGGMGSVSPDVSTADTYAIWTATPALDSIAEKGDAMLTADLKAGRVVYMLFRNDRWNVATSGEPNRHYGITELFVQQYMSFSDNSFVYIDACRGAAQPTLLAAFHAKNASVVAGWTDNAVMGGMQITAKYVFDRLLGANVFAPENPKQRPFEWGALFEDPKFGPGKTYGYTSKVGSSGTPFNANLVFDGPEGGGGDGFQMLAPTILQLAADEQDKQLVISGDFGSDPGPGNRTVTINDGSGEVALAVITWTPATIFTDLKQTGPGSAGDVVVNARGHHSNTRQLLAWNGTLHYTMHEVGSLTQTFDMDFQARSDPLDFRIQIAVAPILPLPPGWVLSIGKQATYSANGSYTSTANQCSLTTDWAGTGTLNSVIGPQPSGKTYTGAGFVRWQSEIFEISLGGTDPTGLEVQQTLKCPMSTQVSNSTDVISVDFTKAGLATGSTSTVHLTFDQALDINSGTLTGSAPSQFDQSAQAKFTLQWSTVIPVPKFNPDVPR